MIESSKPFSDELKKLQRWYSVAVSEEADHWRPKARMWHDYYHGDQLDSDVLKEMKERSQPPIKLNMVKSIVNLVTGQEIQGRTDILFLGNNDKGSITGEVFTNIYRHENSTNGFEYEKTAAFRDAVVGGRGVLYCDYQDGDIVREYVDWEEVYIDPSSKRKDYSDAKFMFRVSWVDLDVAKDLFPEKAKDIQGLHKDAKEELDNDPSYSTDGKNKNYYDDDYDNHKRYIDPGRVRIKLIEAWWKEGNGKNLKINNAIFTDNMFLSEPVESKHKHIKGFPYIFFYYNKDRHGMPYGLVKDLIDAQDVINKMFSKSMHILATNQVLAEAGSITDQGRLQDDITKPDAILDVFKTGALRDGSVKIENNYDKASLAFQHFNVGLDAMNRISGANNELQGNYSNARSGTAISMRMRQGNTVLTDIYDCLEKVSKDLAERFVLLASQYFDKEKIFRYTDNQGEFQTITANKGVSEVDPVTGETISGKSNSLENVFEYDVVISEAAKAGNANEHELTLISEIMKGHPELMTPQLAAEFFRATNLKSKQDLAKAVMPPEQPAGDGTPTPGIIPNG